MESRIAYLRYRLERVERRLATMRQNGHMYSHDTYADGETEAEVIRAMISDAMQCANFGAVADGFAPPYSSEY